MTISLYSDDTKAFLKEYFRFFPEGKKLKKGSELSSLTIAGITLSHPPYQLNNSIIKLNGKLYAIDSGLGANIGEGAFAKVKFAKGLNDDFLTALKIETTNSYSQKNESQILIDLNLTKGKVKRPEKEKYYTPVPYFGRSLRTQLSTQSLSNSERFHIAIMLCYQLYSLHSGLKSKTATAYAHRDLKPDNITWDPTHGLNLVDFGFSREKPLSKNREKMGSALYMALYTRFARDEITNAQHDFLALRRTLYVPDTFVYQNTRRKLFHQTFPNWEMVLSKSMVDAAHLRPYVDTGCRLDEIDDKAEVDFGPLELAAILVVAKLKRFNHYYHQITQDPELASAIVLLYLNLQENDALLKEKVFRLLIGLSSPSFNEDKSTLSLLFFANIIENYNDALLNQDLLDALSNASDHKQQLALGILFKLGLTHPSDFLKLSQTRKLVEAVIFLAKVGAHNAIKNLFESSKHFRCFEALRDADLHSKMADLECRCPISLDYLEKSNDPALSKAIILLVDNNYQSSQIFSSLVQQKNRSFFHKAEHCALKAVYFLHKFHSLRLYLNILQRHKLSLLNRLEAFTESSYFKGFPKRHFDVCLTLVFTNDSFMALVERCGFYDIRLHMVLTLILLGFDNQETLANLASCDDYLMKYYPLFDNGAYKNEIILNVFRDPHYDKAYNLCKKNYISTKDTALILGNKKHLSALLALDESDVNYLQIFDLIKADAHNTTSQLFINRQRSLPRRLPPTPPESSVAIPEALSQLTL